MPSVLFVAGDLSGDSHAAMLAREVQKNHPEWNLFAIGGNALKATGAHMVGDTSGCGVIGIGPALLLVPRLKHLQTALLTFLRDNRVDVAVLCDWGGFNGRILAHFKAIGVPVLYYFPPSSWRKKGEGGLGIVPYVARVATPFPWSAEKLQRAGCNAEWVGHPILETVQMALPRDELRREFGVEEDAKLVALLPGSRNLELKYIAPHLAAAARELQASASGTRLKFIVAVPKGATAKIRRRFDKGFEIVEGRAMDVLLSCDAAVVKSGTVTLEAAVAGAPQVVVYDGPAILHLQWRLMGADKKNPFIAMPNIILERMAAKELLGPYCQPGAIAGELRTLLFDDTKRRQLLTDYIEVRRALGAELPFTATKRTACILADMISDSTH